jgi:hypothetical protein
MQKWTHGMMIRAFKAERSTRSRGIAILLIVFMSTIGNAAENVILHFDQTHGADPLGNLIADKSGNLYGTASSGGLVPLAPVVAGMFSSYRLRKTVPGPKRFCTRFKERMTELYRTER